MKKIPDVEALARLFKEAVSYLEKGDSVQASEKLYKVAEDCVKALAEVEGIREYTEAVRSGGWWTKLLQRAAARLSELYGEELRLAWDAAYKLHIEGFHEGRLTINDVKEEAPKIEELLRIVKGELIARASGGEPKPANT